MSWFSFLMPPLFAGLVAIAVTMAIERWGGRLGGVIGTLPTTIVPAAIGIYGQSPNVGAFRDSMFMTPVGIFINVGFLLFWRLIPPFLPDWSIRKRLLVMIFVSLGLWFVVALTTILGVGWVRSRVDSLEVLGVASTVVILMCGVLACVKSPPAPRGTRKVGVWALLARGALAMAAIGGAISLASSGGAIAAGIASVFPAIFITTMVSLWWSQGEAVQVGAVGPMMLGATSVAAFAVLSAWAFPFLGVFLGVVFSWVASAVLITIPSVLWLRRMTARELLDKEKR